MPDQPIQNYANHKTFDNYLYVLALLDIAGPVLGFVGVSMGVGYIAAGIVCVALSVIGVAIRMRTYATRVQDRIIRLETTLRLERILPEDLKKRIPELALTQIIGLRFASDAEIPELMRKALSGELKKSDDIKKLVKNWQADYLRV